MARIERKAYYVGTWREDVVTDTTMRQIIARSHAEKGQKVKVRLSKEGISLSKTVLFQENFLSSFPLRDVYFLTVNQRHPTCLLCIVADPVKRYLILAIRMLSPVEAQEIIATFQSLKENPTINAGNVVLKRKENGNWTLRERSQHNADRHLQEIFKESSSPTSVPSVPTLQPNGNAGDYAPVLDGRKYISNRHNHAGSQTVVDGSEGDVASMKNEVEQLSQELRDIKFVLEKAGTVSPVVLNSHNHINNNNNTDKSHYVLSEVHARGGHQATNGGIVTAYSDGDGNLDSRPGEARVTVEDYRNHGVARAHSNGSALPDKPAVVMGNGVVQRQITVPEPNTSSTGTPTLSATVAPAPAAPTSNGFSEVPAYTVHRHVTTELVQVPDVGRKLSTAESARSSLRVKFDPESVRRSQDRHHQFRSLRTSRSSGVPTTIVRPIEQIYGHGHGPLVVPVVRTRPSILKRQATPPGDRHMPVRAVYVAQQQQQHQQPSSAVYVAQTNAPNHPQPQAYMTAPPHPVRRSRPSSIHAMDGSELKVFHKTGELDDVLL